MRQRFVILILLLHAGAACAGAPTARQLDTDNPVRPNAPPPFGMEEFFKAAPQQANPARARLGRWLFYDVRLSADRTVSCATCHRPTHAFSEPSAVSTGINASRGTRKTPGIINLAARTILPDIPDDRAQLFFWDGRATSLENQVLAPIANTEEMGLGHEAMIQRFSGIAGYRPYFRDAFGSDEINRDRVAMALADYVRTLMSGNAPYDRWAYGKDPAALSEQAQRGSELFFFSARCAVCHAGFNFSDGRFHNLGVGWDATSQTLADEGRALVTSHARDRGAFKTPGLRDVSKRAPYMHDGSLASLRDVVEFYNRGGVANPWQSGRIRGSLRLTPAQVDELVAFLQSLDGEGYQDQAPRYFPR
ncbi:MAG: cytochrome c peroxidase [Candidatus Hydrogenedentales bacterium]